MTMRRILLVFLVFLMLYRAARGSDVRFNSQLDCTDGCDFHEATSWVSGKVPEVGDAVVIDFSESLARGDQLQIVYITGEASNYDGGLKLASLTVVSAHVMVETINIDFGALVVRDLSKFEYTESGRIAVGQFLLQSSEFYLKDSFLNSTTTEVRSSEFGLDNCETHFFGSVSFYSTYPRFNKGSVYIAKQDSTTSCNFYSGFEAEDTDLFSIETCRFYGAVSVWNLSVQGMLYLLQDQIHLTVKSKSQMNLGGISSREVSSDQHYNTTIEVTSNVGLTFGRLDLNKSTLMVRDTPAFTMHQDTEIDTLIAYNVLSFVVDPSSSQGKINHVKVDYIHSNATVYLQNSLIQDITLGSNNNNHDKYNVELVFSGNNEIGSIFLNTSHVRIQEGGYVKMLNSIQMSGDSGIFLTGGLWAPKNVYPGNLGIILLLPTAQLKLTEKDTYIQGNINIQSGEFVLYSDYTTMNGDLYIDSGILYLGYKADIVIRGSLKMWEKATIKYEKLINPFHFPPPLQVTDETHLNGLIVINAETAKQNDKFYLIWSKTPIYQFSDSEILFDHDKLQQKAELTVNGVYLELNFYTTIPAKIAAYKLLIFGVVSFVVVVGISASLLFQKHLSKLASFIRRRMVFSSVKESAAIEMKKLNLTTPADYTIFSSDSASLIHDQDEINILDQSGEGESEAELQIPQTSFVTRFLRGLAKLFNVESRLQVLKKDHIDPYMYEMDNLKKNKIEDDSIDENNIDENTKFINNKEKKKKGKIKEEEEQVNDKENYNFEAYSDAESDQNINSSSSNLKKIKDFHYHQYKDKYKDGDNFD